MNENKFALNFFFITLSSSIKITWNFAIDLNKHAVKPDIKNSAVKG